MTLQSFPFDAADLITSPEAAATFLADAMESGDARVIADAIEVLDRARARAGSGAASGSDVGDTMRVSFETVVGLLANLGVKLTPEPVKTL